MQSNSAEIWLPARASAAAPTLRPKPAFASMDDHVVRGGGEHQNLVVRYLANAPPEEMAELDRLAELDRAHGNNPTPRG